MLGCAALLGCVHEPFADKLLRQWTYFLTEPYEHGSLGHALWVWIALVNGALGVFMILAPGWEPAARGAVLITAIAGYAVFFVLSLLAVRSPRYGPGVYVAIPLWGAIGAWAIYAWVADPTLAQLTSS